MDWRCLITSPFTDSLGSLKILPPSLTVLPKALAGIMYNQGDSGSPCLRPYEEFEKIVGDFLLRIENFNVEKHFCSLIQEPKSFKSLLEKILTHSVINFRNVQLDNNHFQVLTPSSEIMNNFVCNCDSIKIYHAFTKAPCSWEIISVKAGFNLFAEL